MENKLHISVSPHIRSSITTQRIMLDVIIALLPATVAGCIIFGLSSVFVILACVLSAVVFEYLFNLSIKKTQTISDLSAVVTGLLLALNLPANTPIWQCVVGSAFAIIIVKCLFGGIGCNLVNPAITARVFMLFAFKNLAAPAFPVDAVSSATPLVELAKGEAVPLTDLFLGNVGGAIGETSALALLIGGVYLIARRVITWHMPVSMIGGVFVLSFLLDGFSFQNALCWILSGGLFIGAFFMATDYVTSPVTASGRIIYGIGCGLITMFIRYFGYPEGVSFAILIMNLFTLALDKLTMPRRFGGGKKNAKQ
jgi:electron transport complex protein RnfD